MYKTVQSASSRSLDGSGTVAGAAIGRLVRLAATALRAQVAFVSLAGETQVMRGAAFGIDDEMLWLDEPFCSHLSGDTGVCVVGDAGCDPRFASSPLVTVAAMRFLAGASLRSSDGTAIGALCVLDAVSRNGIDQADASLLEDLAAAVMGHLDLRRELALRRDAQRRLAEQTRLLELAEEMAELGTWRYDLRSGRVYHSPSISRIYGCAGDDGDLGSALALYDPADRARIVEAMDEARATGCGYSVDAKLHRASDGVLRDVRIRARVERDAQGRPASLVGVLLDVTRDKEMLKTINGRRVEADRQADRMRRLASIDALTGLPNRRAFLEMAEDALARGWGLSLVVLDLDHFKSINDRHGHDGGDLVLAAFGRVCQRALAGSARIGRIGGEEFAILMESGDRQEAVAAVEELRRTVAAERLPVARDVIDLTFSAGLAHARVGDTWSTLFGRADRALYGAKNGGRDRLAVAA